MRNGARAACGFKLVRRKCIIITLESRQAERIIFQSPQMRVATVLTTTAQLAPTSTGACCTPSASAPGNRLARTRDYIAHTSMCERRNTYLCASHSPLQSRPALDCVRIWMLTLGRGWGRGAAGRPVDRRGERSFDLHTSV